MLPPLASPAAAQGRLAAQTVAFELNGVRLYIPAQWTITPSRSQPPYDRHRIPAEGTVISVDQFILIGVPHSMANSDIQRYPEIAPPFIYELSLQPGVRDLQTLGERPPPRDVPVARALSEQQPDADGLVRVGPQWYVDAMPHGRFGWEHPLSYFCDADPQPRDRAVPGACKVYDNAIDGVSMRYVWDRSQFPKAQWRALHARVKAFVRWLATPPQQRSAKFDS